MNMNSQNSNKAADQSAYRDKVSKEVLSQLNLAVEKSKIEGGELILSEQGLKIKVQIPAISAQTMQIKWTMSHPLFDEDLVEVSAASGNTLEEAAQKAVKSFAQTTLKVIIQALEHENGERSEVKIDQQTKLFDCYKGDVQYNGSEEARGSFDFFGLLGEEILKRMGNKRVYFIKAFASKMPNGSVSCECFVNGRCYPALTRILKEAAARWETKGIACSQKQCFVFIQDAEGYRPYHFTKQEVQSFTMNALLFYRSCQSEEAFNALETAFTKICHDPTLSKELHVFIPEIFTEVIYPQHEYADEIILQKKLQQSYLCRNQLTAFDWIYDTVERTICAGYYTKEQIAAILKWSATRQIIQEAKKEHPERKTVKLAGLGFYIDDHFTIA